MQKQIITIKQRQKYSNMMTASIKMFQIQFRKMTNQVNVKNDLVPNKSHLKFWKNVT